MIIHPDRLAEMQAAPREAMIGKAEIIELIRAYQHVAELSALFEHATCYSFDGYTAMRDQVKETATPWADLQMRVPDNNCLLEGSRGPQCRYCGEVYASPNSDDGHSRNCNRPARYRKP